METKSRYEVIAELETKKRELIKEGNGLNDVLIAKEKSLKNVEREKSDDMLAYDRRIEDLLDEIKNFKDTMKERKETITELIKSIDESLARFGKLSEAKK